MKKIYSSIFIGLIVLLLPVLVMAQIPSNTSGNTPPSNTSGNTPPSNSSGNSSTQTVSLVNPLGVNSFCELLKVLLNAALQIGIPIAVLFLIYAGFLFVWARGNSAGLKTARQNLLYVVIGIALFLGAWTLGQILVSTINSIQPSGGPLIQAC